MRAFARGDLGVGEKPLRRRHDLGDAGLVVRAEERLAVRGDDVVPDPLPEEPARGGGDRLGRVAREHELAAVVVVPESAARRRCRTRRAPCRRARRRPTVGPFSAPTAGSVAEHVAVLGQLDVVEPERLAARQRAAARARAASACSGRSPRRARPACRSWRSARIARARRRRARRRSRIRRARPPLESMQPRRGPKAPPRLRFCYPTLIIPRRPCVSPVGPAA